MVTWPLPRRLPRTGPALSFAAGFFVRAPLEKSSSGLVILLSPKARRLGWRPLKEVAFVQLKEEQNAQNFGQSLL